MVSCRACVCAPLYDRSGQDAGDRCRRCRVAANPLPAEGFHAGEYHRLRVGDYRVMYVVEGDLVTVSSSSTARELLTFSRYPIPAQPRA